MLKRLIVKLHTLKLKEGLDVIGFGLATTAVLITFGIAPALGVAAAGCFVVRFLMD